MTEVLIAGLIVNIVAGLFLFLMQGKVEEWRLHRKYMIYVLALGLLALASLSIVLSRFANSLSVQFVPRHIQISIPDFILRIPGHGSSPSLKTAITFSTSLFIICLSLSFVLPRLINEAWVYQGPRLERLGRQLSDATMSFLFATFTIALYKMTQLDDLPISKAPHVFQMLFTVSFSSLIFILLLFRVPSEQYRRLFILTFIAGTLFFVISTLLVIL
jgi:hypothetical protein